MSGQAVQRCSKWQCEKLLVCDATREYRDRAKYTTNKEDLHDIDEVSRWGIRGENLRKLEIVLEHSESFAPTNVQAGRGLRYN